MSVTEQNNSRNNADRIRTAVKQRDYYFDNLKAVLIFLVIMGHLVRRIRTDLFFEVRDFIYLFHMPLFIFVSGYFSKGFYKGGKYRWYKLINFLILFVLYVTLVQISYVIFQHDAFNPKAYIIQSGAPWYLLCMFYWYALIPLTRKLPGWILIPFSLIPSALAGRFPQIGTFLCLSRAIIFWPFFLMGYYCTHGQIERLRQPDLRLLGLLCGGLTGAVFHLFRNKFPGWAYIIFARYSYDELEISTAGGILLRLAVTLAAVLFSMGLMALIPSGKTPVSHVGRDTLPIYILHRPFVVAAGAMGLFEAVPDDSILSVLLFAVLALLLAWLLSRPPIVKGFGSFVRLLGVR